MKVLVFGLDGFCAWPMSLALAAAGHEVLGVDNELRRKIDKELGTTSLTPIATYRNRIHVARGYGLNLNGDYCNSTDYSDVHRVIANFRPDVIFHTAEIRAAPYSMIDSSHKSQTVANNILGTQNILNAMVELGLSEKTHLVHIGTMGVYGYGGTAAVLPEGYADITIHGADLQGNPVEDHRSSLFPTDPGSVYHMTKSMEQIMFAFYAKNNGLRITDLHQGIIWGTQTPETSKDPALVNRFDYDEVYGTVLNRFLVQSAIGHPLTVYGTGGQTRGFININDATKCVKWAVEDLNYEPRVRIINQVTEFHTVSDLADLVCSFTGAQRASYVNPRKEKAANTLAASNAYFQRKGLTHPITVSSQVLNELDQFIKPNIDRIDVSHIPPKTQW